MSFGYERQPRVFLHDTARLAAYVYLDDGETPVPQSQIDSVTFSIRRPLDNDRPSYILYNGLRIQANDPGLFGNAYTVAFIDPATAGELSADLVDFDLTVTLAHDGNQVTSTVGDVVELLQNDPDIYPYLIATVA